MTKKEVENIVEDMWHNSGWKTIARWHLSEIKKAELRARIDELETLGGDIEENNVDHDLQVVYQERDDRIHQYQSELRKMEEDNEG